MTENKKCRAKGGPAFCTDPNCPEKQAHVDFEVPSLFKKTQFKPTVAPPVGSWSEKDTVLYKTIHGSRLYNLANADSDEDFYVVTPTVKTRRMINATQKLEGNLDTVAIDFSSFVQLAHKGVPQALETMFSQQSQSNFFEEYRNGFRTADSEVIGTYLKTIKSMALFEKKPFKHRRHAMRLSLNLEQLLYTGRFNPTLSPADVSLVNRLAEKEGEPYFKELNKLQPIDLNWDTWNWKKD